MTSSALSIKNLLLYASDILISQRTTFLLNLIVFSMTPADL